jgi:hypothetical protein
MTQTALPNPSKTIPLLKDKMLLAEKYVSRRSNYIKSLRIGGCQKNFPKALVLHLMLQGLQGYGGINSLWTSSTSLSTVPVVPQTFI